MVKPSAAQPRTTSKNASLAKPYGKPVSAATRAMLDAMSEDRPVASENQLDVIRAKVRELRDLEIERAQLEERQRSISERRRVLVEKEIVDVMDAASVPAITIAAEGNMPQFEVEIGPYYHANIAADWPEPQREKAFAWIRKYHDGMLRSTITASLGKNSGAQQKALEEFLVKKKISFKVQFGVPHNTLTAFVKEQIEERKKTPPLALLGATVGRVAKIKKEKK